MPVRPSYSLWTAIILLVAAGRGQGAERVTGAIAWDSSRYLDVDRLTPGMRGYAKTVFSGDRIETFEVEIVAIRPNVSPGRSMILGRCHGKNIEQTKVAAGMSGSPVYVRDPSDGRDKLIGAIAYGWLFQQGTLTGIQPIRSMIEATGPMAVGDASGGSVLAIAPESRLGMTGLAAYVTGPHAGEPPLPSAMGTTMGRLATPVVTGGASPPTVAWLGRQMEGGPLLAVAGGGSAGDAAVAGTRLEPGSVLAIPILDGPFTLTAIGTVTDVIGQTVIGFGHAMNGEGATSLPLAGGVIQAVVPSTAQPFKIGSAGQTVGTLDIDRYTAVVGTRGPMPGLIPLTVTTDLDGRSRTDSYTTADHDYFTERKSKRLNSRHGQLSRMQDSD